MTTSSQEIHDPASVELDACQEMVFDRGQLVRRCMGNLQLVERLLASFEQRFPDELQQVEMYLAQGDCDRAIRTMHQLKGAAANISAPTLSASLSEAEEAARENRWKDVTACLSAAHAEWDRLQASLHGDMTEAV